MRVRNHWWWRPGWQAGRLIYSWHITFSDDEPTCAHVAAYQKALEPFDYLDLVPPAWLHLTTQDVFFVDEGSDEQLGGIVEGAQSRLSSIPSFEAELNVPEVWGEGVVLRPQPAEPFVRIRDALRDAIGAVRGESGVLGNAVGFRPHISLAYANGDGSGKDLESAVEAVAIPSTSCRIDRVTLIRQERVDRLYRWDVVTTVPLLGGAR